MDRRLARAMDRVSVGTLVISGLFDSGSYQNTAVAAGDQVDFGRANYVAHQIARGTGDRQHLSLDRTSRDRVQRQLSRPGPGAIHDRRSVVTGLGGDDAGRIPI